MAHGSRLATGKVVRNTVFWAWGRPNLANTVGLLGHGDDTHSSNVLTIYWNDPCPVNVDLSGWGVVSISQVP